MKSILYIRGVDGAMGNFAQTGELQRNANFCSVYDLAQVDLSTYSSILISAHVDQIALQKQHHQLQFFLEQGGVFVINGHITYPFLDELCAFIPLKDQRLDNLRIKRLNKHAIFEGVSVDDLTFRRGVAGFYGRGYNPAPEGSLLIHAVGEGMYPVDWLYHHSSGGAILMHSSNDIWMHAADKTSARHIAPQLLSWLLEEANVKCVK